jgi:hypothetical protein
MKETKDYPQSEADQDFAKLLKNIRTEENVWWEKRPLSILEMNLLLETLG